MMGIVVRIPILFLYVITGRYNPLFRRAAYMEIGYIGHGHVSLMDSFAARELKLKPLNRFERWLMRPITDSEKKRLQKNSEENAIEVASKDSEVNL